MKRYHDLRFSVTYPEKISQMCLAPYCFDKVYKSADIFKNNMFRTILSLPETVEIEIINDPLNLKYFAYVCKNSIIHINPYTFINHFERVRKILSHELIHVWQSHTNIFQHKKDGLYWKGKKYKLPYLQTPWEMQARKLTELYSHEILSIKN